MKILIWIKKEDAISGNITEHHIQCPQPGYQNYIQVIISQDEFVRLRDKALDTKETYPDFARKHYHDLDKEFDETAFGD